MGEKKNILKNKYVLIAIIGVLVIIVIGISYAFFQVDLKGTEEVGISTGGLKFNYVQGTNNITITNAEPMSDDTGKALGQYFDFSVGLKSDNNLTIGYYIYLTKTQDTTLSDDSLKIYITDQSNVEIVAPTLISDLTPYYPVSLSKVIYESSISSNNGVQAIDNYRLRVWLDEGYEPEYQEGTDGDEQYIEVVPKTYKFKVNVTNISYETSEECFTYTTDTVSATITDYKCYAGNSYGLPTITDVIIPKKLGGKSVTKIANTNSTLKQSFFSKGLTSIIFPETLISIGEWSFFENANITDVVIPDNVTTIGNYAFYANNTIERVKLGNSLTTIGNSAFRMNQITSLTIPDSVEVIADVAFSSNALTELVIPDNVTTVAYNSFSNNNLTHVTIGTGVLTIGSGAFAKTSTSNPNLTTIVNKTGRSFNWGWVITQAGDLNIFVTGTVTNPFGTVQVVSE